MAGRELTDSTIAQATPGGTVLVFLYQRAEVLTDDSDRGVIEPSSHGIRAGANQGPRSEQAGERDVGTLHPPLVVLELLVSLKTTVEVSVWCTFTLKSVPVRRRAV